MPGFRMDTIYSLFPNADDLLNLAPEDVAPVLLKLALAVFVDADLVRKYVPDERKHLTRGPAGAIKLIDIARPLIDEETSRKSNLSRVPLMIPATPDPAPTKLALGQYGQRSGPLRSPP